MEFFTNPVVATVLFLGILVFVHEAGHFLVGKAVGISVEIFSIGFGPVIFSFQRKETNYRLSVIPLGGYVKFFGAVRGEEVPAHLKGTEFYQASIPARLATVAAGPLANFLLAIVVFAAVGLHGVSYPPAVVGQVMPSSPAERAGLQFGDHIKAINGDSIKHWRDLQRSISSQPGEALVLELERGKESLKKIITPDTIEDKEMASSKGRIGISPSFTPPVVSIAHWDSPAAKAGVPTGFRVEKITWDSKSRSIKFWNDIDIALRELGPDLQELTLEGYQTLGDPRESLAEEKKKKVAFTLDLKGISSISSRAIGLQDALLTIGTFLEDEIIGLEVGDSLVAWNGQALENIFTLSELLSDSREPEATLSILRNGRPLQVQVKLQPVEVQRAEGRITLYRIPALFWAQLENAEPVEEKYSNPLSAVVYGAKETYFISKEIATAVLGLFTGDMPLKALGGPIAIAKVASDSVKMGLLPFLHLLAMISINLGLLNLIPIPVLDGGQIVLIGAEGLVRRPLSMAIIEGYQKVGFIMVLALIAMATYNDLGRFWASMLAGASSIF